MILDGFFLPSPTSGGLYRDLAWIIVVLALGTGLLRQRKRDSAVLLAGWIVLVLATFAAFAFFAQLRPAHGFALAFQSPSLLLMLLLLASLVSPRASSALLAARLRGVVFVVTIGLIASLLAFIEHDLYVLGFHRWAGPVLFGTAAVLVGWRSPDALMLATTALLFELTRWPTGNAWDALTDPWLALWAAWRGLSHFAGRRRV